MPSDNALAEAEWLYLWTLYPCCVGEGCSECAPQEHDDAKEKD